MPDWYFFACILDISVIDICLKMIYNIFIILKGDEIMQAYKNFIYKDSGVFAKIDQLITDMGISQRMLSVDYAENSENEYRGLNISYAEMHERRGKNEKELHRAGQRSWLGKQVDNFSEQLKREMKKVSSDNLKNFLNARKEHYIDQREKGDPFNDNHYQVASTLRAQSLALSAENKKVKI